MHGQKDEYLNAQCTIKLALTIEAIWKLRNLVVHNNVCVNLISIIQGLELRMIEHLDALKGANIARSPELCCWKCPPSGVIKLNVDAAIARDSTTLAVVACDDHGRVLKAWKREHILCMILSKPNLLLYFRPWS